MKSAASQTSHTSGSQLDSGSASPPGRLWRILARFPLPALSGATALALGVSGEGCTSTPSATPEEDRSQLSGEQLFSKPFPGAKNKRSCATCHVPEDNFTLTPAHVTELWESNPDDPLFSAIDADDPEAEDLTFEHLKKGLVRVWLTIPDNMDLIDAEGEVITPKDRKMFVWRAVPTIADSAFTAPYQHDGRLETLEDQAQGAVTSHSEGGTVPRSELERIAEFERTVFSSNRSKTVYQELEAGTPLTDVTPVEDDLELSAQEKRGQAMYEAVCASCHGGAKTNGVLNREIHDLAFPVIKTDGNVQYQVPATSPPTLVLASQPNNEFINAGIAVEMYLAQLGATEHESFSKDVDFPNYRYRFYTDGSRTEIAADLPPAAPAFTGGGAGGPPGGGGAGGGDGGGGVAFNVEVDEDGNPVTGPNFIPQFFSTDPGRAMITGSPNDFEAFDVPSLRGIARTAPYFHNNTVSTLEEVVSLYSDHLLSRFPSLTQPGEKEPDPDGDTGPEETFTAEQKKDLVAYLKKL